MHLVRGRLASAGKDARDAEFRVRVHDAARACTDTQVIQIRYSWRLALNSTSGCFHFAVGARCSVQLWGAARGGRRASRADICTQSQTYRHTHARRDASRPATLSPTLRLHPCDRACSSSVTEFIEIFTKTKKRTEAQTITEPPSPAHFSGPY